MLDTEWFVASQVITQGYGTHACSVRDSTKSRRSGDMTGALSLWGTQHRVKPENHNGSNNWITQQNFDTFAVVSPTLPFAGTHDTHCSTSRARGTSEWWTRSLNIARLVKLRNKQQQPNFSTLHGEELVPFLGEIIPKHSLHAGNVLHNPPSPKACREKIRHAHVAFRIACICCFSSRTGETALTKDTGTHNSATAITLMLQYNVQAIVITSLANLPSSWKIKPHDPNSSSRSSLRRLAKA